MECGLRALQELILLVRAREKQKIGRLAMNTNYKDKKTISGDDQEAFNEFLAGKERWNAYVEKHGDDTEVDFSGIDFPKRRKNVDELNFSGYRFPTKGVVNFGNGNVNFTYANFGQGVSFMCANFGEGDVNFSNAQFGEGNVDFRMANFGKGDVYFYNVNFGDGYVNFNYAKFLGKGMVSFNEAEFGECSVEFYCVQFGDGDIGFYKAKFGKGAVKFNRAQFGDGYVKFNGAQFGDDDVEFSYAKFGNGDLEFKGAKFGNGTLNFEHCEFKGYVSFQSMTDPKTLLKISLRHSSFDKSLDISDNTFNCIPDLTNTKLTNQVSLDRMEISDNYPPKGDFDKSDGERLCRLKELAKANKNHQQALGFHVIEMRAKRYNTKLIKGKTPHMLLDILFDIACLYGQSIIRPLLSLSVLTIVCACIYAYESSLDYFPFCYGLLYSLSQVFSFVPAGRSITIGILDKLFPCETIIPDGVYFFSLLQGVLSFVLLFFIGLGFRNRFRL
ncbi:hypothetical protein BJAS_P4704 [Bathymodiolus japonicus methanotrophic gill symbiont]|uniref:pentapeptide repeat-containing protein n=1 Tax=Bathymodiolus japonicus methanotrophic gill symbiont TaxID=113269 RepID=UPI001B3FA9E1|nr:pentapeptide repeat-containing protein [Bathymodiolus japonicus methanotrophic gill symbiont]GFO73719.1 hypothetical protein BJAS_P4704 [Bathymodiolus japonicus methanotrophic gill symbiont]